MGWAERKRKEAEAIKKDLEGFAEKLGDRLLVIVPNEEVKQKFIDFTRRTANMLDIIEEFINKTCELDEDSPQFLEEIQEPMSTLMIQLMMSYPSLNYLITDKETLRNLVINSNRTKEGK